MLDFGMGDPREPTGALHPRGTRRRSARADGLSGRSRTARAARSDRRVAGRRFGTALDLATEVIPTSAARRRRSSLSRSRSSIRTARATRSPSLIPATRSTSAARCSPTHGRCRCRCARSAASSSTSTRSTTRRGAGWRSSGSTTRTTRRARPRRLFYEHLAGLAREHGFAVASDEAYTELWFDEPPACSSSSTARTSSSSPPSPSGAR